MGKSRQLAAIMFADIVGYTAMMQEDEELAFELRSKLKDKLEDEVRNHGGRILEFKGDGALCSFNSAIEGVRAALGLQLAMQTAPFVPLRVGMHTGDVVVENDAIYGDGVNIASRMESFAVPGSIFISGRVYDDIKNQRDIQTVSLGKYALKNVKEEVEIYAISNPGLQVPELHSLAGKGRKILQKSVMVLPFVNMTAEAEQEYFSDGLTEELILNLSRINDIRVISRTTSMQYKGTTKDVKTIGNETGVSYLVEGSVRKFKDDLRITAQFIDANKDTHLWAETYRGSMEDVFDIQEKVSAKIVDALRMQLSHKEKQTLQKRFTEDSQAYQLYLQGRFFWNKRDDEGLNIAIRYFEEALKKDPNYALAWAGLADSYSLMGEYTNISRREFYPKQMEAINKALEIDDHLAEAHISLAISLMLNEWDWINSEKEFKIGIDLNPNYATGHHWYSQWLLYHGKFDEALDEISLAIELDPVSQGILKDKGIHHYYHREYDEAIATGLQVLELNSGFAPAHRLLSLAYAGKGLFNKAIGANQKWGELTRNRIKTEVSLVQIYAASGLKSQAARMIKNIESGDLGANDIRGMALVYAALNENDMAFSWLEKSYEKHEESLCNIRIDPKLDSLRSDPRYDLLVKKIGL
ncbi:MAG TPA: adenylate/guanylate cyclase domain-containing protein [Chitinophagaceae bacterium]|jgi:TolB-like protein/class 3 adenylate cyclase|nr:adenylate/guanylate cyclase domain-containing protein [Chitinophagaceae bacterium]